MATLKKKLSKFDMFPASPILRAEGETEVVNLCGSIFSILVFSVFIYIFISATISTVNLENISATEILQMDRPLDEPIANVTAAVGLQWMNMTSLRSIFQLRAFIAHKNMDFQQIEVFPCTRQMWKQLDDDKYHTLGISGYMCIQREGISIFGQFGAKDMRILYWNVSQCDNATSPVPCAPQIWVDYFFDNYMIWNRFFGCSIYILDTRINANKENPLSYTIYQKTIWLLFNRNQFTLVQAFLGTYEINTDSNLWPWVQNDYKTGYFVTEAITIDFVNPNFTYPIYAEGFILTSSTNMVVNRKFGKIDDVLSYVGGLFGIVISFFSFFLLSFNQYRYELRVSEGAFTFSDGHLAKQSDFHFLKFLKYVAFDWIKTIFCCEPNWEDCKAINEARQQAIEQIDVKHLLQRINHLEQVIANLVPQQNETVMYLAQSHSIQEVKRRRKIVDYCNKFAGSDKSMTIRNFQQLTAFYNFGMSLVSNSNPKVFPQQNNNTSQVQLTRQKQNKSSIQIMQEYIQKYREKFSEDFELVLNEEQIQVEKQIAEAFFQSDQKTRISLIRKIPIGILNRINGYKNNYIDSEVKKEKQQFSGQYMLKPLRSHGKIKKRKIQLQNLDSTLQFKN